MVQSYSGRKKNQSQKFGICLAEISDITKTAIPKSWYYAVFSRIP